MHQDLSATPADDTQIAIPSLLDRISELLAGIPEAEFDEASLGPICDEFRILHAQLRIHHAANWLGSSTQGESLPPEQAMVGERLKNEYRSLLGAIDRVLRAAPSVIAKGAAETEILYLRMREIVATVRRHRAEEAQLMYNSAWFDVGGES